MWMELPLGFINFSWRLFNNIFLKYQSKYIFGSIKYQYYDAFIFSFHAIPLIIEFISSFWFTNMWDQFFIYSLGRISIKNLPQAPPGGVRTLNLMSQIFPVKLSQTLFLFITTRKCRAVVQSYGLRMGLWMHGK